MLDLIKDRIVEVFGSISLAAFIGSEHVQHIAAFYQDTWHYAFLDESLKFLSIVTCAITIYTFAKNMIKLPKRKNKNKKQ